MGVPPMFAVRREVFWLRWGKNAALLLVGWSTSQSCGVPQRTGGTPVIRTGGAREAYTFKGQRVWSICRGAGGAVLATRGALVLPHPRADGGGEDEFVGRDLLCALR